MDMVILLVAQKEEIRIARSGTDGGDVKGPNIPYSSGVVVQPKAIPVENHPEVPPTLAFLTIPQEVSWLKNF